MSPLLLLPIVLVLTTVVVVVAALRFGREAALARERAREVRLLAMQGAARLQRQVDDVARHGERLSEQSQRLTQATDGVRRRADGVLMQVRLVRQEKRRMLMRIADAILGTGEHDRPASRP